MKYKPHFTMCIERDRFIIKTVDNIAELTAALRLRHEVFYEELLGKKKLGGLDKDKFDLKCDHLIIVEKKSNKVIGTYRLISSLFSRKFYSETEFNLKGFLKIPGVKLELGRACVHKDYRTGSSIALLWRGISEYMKVTNTTCLFGCSSIMTTSKAEIVAVSNYFSKNVKNMLVTAAVSPRLKYKLMVTKNFMRKTFNIEAETLIPPLVKAYLKMGAVVCAEPAIDRRFKCADYFTLFNLATSNEKTQKKYDLRT